MSLQALYQQRQRERGDESKNLDAAWKQAGAAFTNAALGAHAHVTASCAPLKNNQAEVLAVTQVVRQQIQELDSCVTAWTGLLSEVNQVFMELGDLEHYAAVIARQALVVKSAVETIVDRRQHGHGHGHSDNDSHSCTRSQGDQAEGQQEPPPAAGNLNVQ